MAENSAQYFRKGFGLKAEVEHELKSEYQSELIAGIRANGNTLVRGNITIKLAQAFGFCWGVDRAVSMAYETRRHFPDQRIWITNEIIHNPVVNDNLRAMDIQFVPLQSDGEKDFSGIGQGEVVILPAFGASVQEMQRLESKNCQIVDTTCPWVSRVWNRVAKYEQSDFTAIVHGKYNHEETIATSSRSKTYLVVQNLPEANLVCSYILNGGDRAAFLRKFKVACSEGFDPDVHLETSGCCEPDDNAQGRDSTDRKAVRANDDQKVWTRELGSTFPQSR